MASETQRDPSIDDDDEDDAPDSEDERRRRRERAKKKKAKPVIPSDEREIDAPDKLTLSMLGVMAVVTIVLWGFARGACNYHPPRETRRPRTLKLEELAREPKDAALEMQQRLVQLDFEGAVQLATGEAAAEVAKAKAACEAQHADCVMKRKQLSRSVDSTAQLLERSASNATVRVTTVKPGGKETTLAKLEKQGPIWKVASRGADDPNFKPAPPDAPTMQLLAAPPASSIPAKPRDDDE